MHHVAIMNKKWNLIPKILSGDKTIESRWYKNRAVPWNKVNEGDLVYFKNSGEKISAVAKVEDVKQFENINNELGREILNKYNDRILLEDRSWIDGKNYCVLVFLKDAKPVEAFQINKKGFGSAAAWLVVENISEISF